MQISILENNCFSNKLLEDPISRLPNELILHIFGFLSEVELCKLSETNRMYKAIIKSEFSDKLCFKICAKIIFMNEKEKYILPLIDNSKLIAKSIYYVRDLIEKGFPACYIKKGCLQLTLNPDFITEKKHIVTLLYNQVFLYFRNDLIQLFLTDPELKEFMLTRELAKFHICFYSYLEKDTISLILNTIPGIFEAEHEFLGAMHRIGAKRYLYTKDSIKFYPLHVHTHCIDLFRGALHDGDLETLKLIIEDPRFDPNILRTDARFRVIVELHQDNESIKLLKSHPEIKQIIEEYLQQPFFE